MSCHSNFHWFLMHWHIKFFALLYQFCCIFIIKLLLFGCLTFTLLEYPLQHQWYLIVMSNMVWALIFFKSLVLSDFSFVFVLHFTGKPNLTNLSKSRKNAQIVYEISHNSNVLSWKHNTLEKLQLWLSLANDHF